MLPSGFALPPLPYLVGLVAAVGVAVAALRRRRPSVTEAAVAAFAPWMAADRPTAAASGVGRATTAPASATSRRPTPVTARTAGAPAVLGDAWLFVLVKLLAGAAVVVAFDDYVRETPTEGYPLLGLVAAVGLGPGAHNVVLFAVA